MRHLINRGMVVLGTLAVAALGGNHLGSTDTLPVTAGQATRPGVEVALRDWVRDLVTPAPAAEPAPPAGTLASATAEEMAAAR